jgi:hypothetical protein
MITPRKPHKKWDCPCTDCQRWYKALCEELREALGKALKALEYCATDPRELHPLNNSQNTVAWNALPEARAALKKASDI